jgi:hypothetical protein
MLFVSLYCMVVIAYCIYRGDDTRVAETAVEMSFIALISIVGSYVFGATWQDISTVNRGYGEFGSYARNQPYQEWTTGDLPPVVPGRDLEK